MFRSLAIFNYRVWFFGALVSNVGTWVQRIGQDWLVLTQLSHESGLAVGITTGLQFMPQLFLAPLAGLIADRYNKRKILVATQLAMMLTSITLAVLVFSGHITLVAVYILAFLLGVAAAIDAPARQTFVSELVSHDDVANAVGLNSVSFNIARLIGPAGAGFLIDQVGTGWSFAINAVTFLAMIWALIAINPAELVAFEKVKAHKGALREGFQYIWRRGDILMVIVMVALTSALALNFQLTIALMARIQFNRGAGDFGLLNTAMAIGAMSGALISARMIEPKLRMIITSCGFLGLAMLLATIAPNYVTFAITLVICGYFTLRLLNTANAYIQLTTSSVMRGRVMSIYLAFFLGVAPFGSPLVGWIGEVLGPRMSIFVGALSAIVGALLAVGWAIVTGRLTKRSVSSLLHRAPREGALDDVTIDPSLEVAHPETGPIPLPDRREVDRESKR